MDSNIKGEKDNKLLLRVLTHITKSHIEAYVNIFEKDLDEYIKKEKIPYGQF